MTIDSEAVAVLLAGGAFVALWLAISYAISYQIGWPALTRVYRATRPFRGERVRVRHAQFRRSLGGGLNNALSIGVNAEGIELHMFILFSINCPRLFVPWRELRVSRGRWWRWSYVEFEFAQVPDGSLRIFGAAGERLREAAGAAWPERPAPIDPIRR